MVPSSETTAFLDHVKVVNLRQMRIASAFVALVFLLSAPMDFLLVPDRLHSFFFLRAIVFGLAGSLTFLCAVVPFKWSWLITAALYLVIAFGMAGVAYLYPEGADLIQRTVFGFILLLPLFTIWPWPYALGMSLLMSSVAIGGQALQGASTENMAIDAMYLLIASAGAGIAASTMLGVRHSEFESRAELEETNRQLQKITSMSPNLIYVFDLAQRNFAYANRAVTGYMGYTLTQAQELGDALIQSVVHPEDLPALERHLASFGALKEDEVAEITQRVRSADGEWRWLLQREIVFKRDAEGRPTQVLGIAQDVTDIREQNRLLRENQEVMDHEMVMARQIQQALLPLSPPKVTGARLFSEYIALSKVGGDFIDYLVARDGSCGIFLGDAAGHGVPAALVGSMAKMALDTLRRDASTPARMLGGLNKSLYGKTSGNFVVACYAHFNPRNRELRYALAGNPPPFLMRAGEPALQLEGVGKPLGLVDDPNYREHIITLRPGDRLLMLTDGILECRSERGTDLEFEQVTTILSGISGIAPQGILLAIVSQLNTFVGSRGFEDDVTMVLLAVDEEQAEVTTLGPGV